MGPGSCSASPTSKTVNKHNQIAASQTPSGLNSVSSQPITVNITIYIVLPPAQGSLRRGHGEEFSRSKGLNDICILRAPAHVRQRSKTDEKVTQAKLWVSFTSGQGWRASDGRVGCRRVSKRPPAFPIETGRPCRPRVLTAGWKVFQNKDKTFIFFFHCKMFDSNKMD